MLVTAGAHGGPEPETNLQALPRETTGGTSDSWVGTWKVPYPSKKSANSWGQSVQTHDPKTTNKNKIDKQTPEPVGEFSHSRPKAISQEADVP